MSRGQTKARKNQARYKRTPSPLLVAHDIDDALRKTGAAPAVPRSKTFRYGNDIVVTWQAGRFSLRVADPQAVKGLAPCPQGLRRRVREAIRKGQDHG